jgi:hypothetical protein
MANDRQLNLHTVGQVRFLYTEIDDAELQHFASFYRHAPALRPQSAQASGAAQLPARPQETNI